MKRLPASAATRERLSALFSGTSEVEDVKGAMVEEAVRLRDGKFVFLRESGRFNAESFWVFLHQLYAQSQTQGRRVVAIVDNARYHHARLHKPWREEHDAAFQLDYLPPYSPELNPSERVWKLTRRLCTHNRYFASLDNVCDAVENQFTSWEPNNETLRRLCAIT